MSITNIAARRKIEITLTLPDSSTITFTEDDIIRCVLSLRSDLSIENPTLPESEMEAEIYCENFDSEMAANLPDETSVTYRCTESASSQQYIYWGNLRYFYTDDVSWEKNVLRIHARDQVHKLDEELPAIYIGQRWRGDENQANSRGLLYLYMAFCDAVNGVAEGGWLVGDVIEHLTFPGYSNHEGTSSSGDNCDAIMERMTRREFVAKMMNLCRFKFESGFLNSGYDTFLLDYVDAGIPKLTTYRTQSVNFNIYEEDCGNIQESRPKNVSQYNFRIRDVWASSTAGGDADSWPIIDGGSASVIAAVGMSLNYREYTDYFEQGLLDTSFGPTYIWPLWYYTAPNQYLYRARPYYSSIDITDIDQLRSYRYGYWLLDNDAQSNPFNFSKFDFIDFTGSIWTTPMSTGNQSPQQRWASYKTSGLIDSTATDATLQMSGYYYDLTNERTYLVQTGKNGAVVEPSDVMWNGVVYAVGKDNTTRKKVLPDLALQNLASRSQLGGSFTHRGEPNWQPRDYFRFWFIERMLLSGDGDQLTDENGNELMIGGYEERTVETITTTHEKGGTVSEITYKVGSI